MTFRMPTTTTSCSKFSHSNAVSRRAVLKFDIIVALLNRAVCFDLQILYVYFISDWLCWFAHTLGGSCSTYACYTRVQVLAVLQVAPGSYRSGVRSVQHSVQSEGGTCTFKPFTQHCTVHRRYLKSETCMQECLPESCTRPTCTATSCHTVTPAYTEVLGLFPFSSL